MQQIGLEILMVLFSRSCAADLNASKPVGDPDDRRMNLESREPALGLRRLPACLPRPLPPRSGLLVLDSLVRPGG